MYLERGGRLTSGVLPPGAVERVWVELAEGVEEGQHSAAARGCQHLRLGFLD